MDPRRRPPPPGRRPPPASGPRPSSARAPAAKPAPPPPEPEPPPAPKSFEIRRGRSGRQAEESDESDPIQHVVLPRSITQEQEEDNLKKRFGVDQLPDLGQRDARVLVTDSGGSRGPDRYLQRRLRTLLLVLIALVAAAAAYQRFVGPLPFELPFELPTGR